MSFRSLLSKFNTINPATAAKGSELGIDPIKEAKVIVDSIEDGVILIDSQQTIQLINPAGSNLCGWSTEEAIGINSDLVFQLVNDKGEAISKSNNPMHLIFDTGKGITSRNYSLHTKDGQIIPIRLHVSPLSDAKSKLNQAVAVFNNISEEKSEEKQRGDFISTASHEMRTPVAAIEGYLALALNDKVATIDSRAKDYLEKAHSSTEHLGLLFQDLLTSAKAEDGRLTSHPVVVEMGEYLTKLSSDLHLVAAKKGLAMYMTSGTGTTVDASTNSVQKVVTPLYYVYVDPDRLREVITNLFDNAVKYTPEGRITLGFSGNGQVVQCYIKDTGPGIPREDIPHLFQKFYRVDNSSTRTIGGTGLGLFICRKIIELYNGRIWAESEVGKGSTFYINLPRLTQQKVKELQARERENTDMKPISSLASA
jgi:two-component system sensor histidine kinase VicK